MSEQAKVFYDNALELLRQERRSSSRVNAAYKTLTRNHIEAGAETWLANPFVRTALSILQSLSGNYKIREAIRLLKEAGTEAETASKKKAPSTKKWR